LLVEKYKNMKTFKLLLILTLAVTLFSCGSDDDNNITSPNADLLGSWNGTSIDGTSDGTIEEDGFTVPFTGTYTGSNINYSLTFTETPNNITSQGTFDALGSIMLGGQTFTENVTGETFLDSTIATWTRSGGTLTISDDGATDAYTMVITGNTMTLTISTTETEIDEGTTTTSNLNLVASFIKQ
jgi:hypothetical protein|tara:strand:+ start:964 stop:1515 length:552 start_codon:yes stop_codon:yes gene_type:complete